MFCIIVYLNRKSLLIEILCSNIVFHQKKLFIYTYRHHHILNNSKLYRECINRQYATAKTNIVDKQYSIVNILKNPNSANCTDKKTTISTCDEIEYLYYITKLFRYF